MFAYGVGPCARVDLVTGPGSIWTVTAKRLLKGKVGIDSEAGPTEILILADETADPAYVAADLLSQAEHDPLAAAVLVTTSRGARRPGRRRARRARCSRPSTPSGSRPRWPAPQSGVVLVDDLDQGVDVANAYAAEHLEIHTADAAAVAARIRNAGAIFVGPHAPVSLGDYCAGSNHVLPTGGCACHSSGLSVRAFTKSVHVVDYSREALAEVADHVVTLAEAEDLPGHGAAVRVAVRGLHDASRPSATSCRGSSRTAPRSSTCRSSSTSTRTPTAPRPSASPTSPPSVAAAAGTLNRYPDREFTELRDRAGGVPLEGHAARDHARSRCGRPTAPTR